MSKNLHHTNDVIWPAIIHYYGQAELGFVVDQQSWENDQHIQTTKYHASDELIDSVGKVYRLINKINAPIHIKLINKTASLQDVIEMGRVHISASGVCCGAKFSATSIQQAVSSLAVLNNS